MKDHISYDSVGMKCPEQANLQRQKIDQWLPRARGESKVEQEGNSEGVQGFIWE